jgi:MSHA biogenesis protein MshN
MKDVAMPSLVSFPERHAGAARLSVFFAMWTLALLLLHDVRVNAAPVYDAPTSAGPGWWVTPAPAPSIDSASVWEGLAQRSDVISGRWNVASNAVPAKVEVRSAAAAHDDSRPAPVAKPRVAATTSAATVATVPMKRASTINAAQSEIAQRIASGDIAGAQEVLVRARQESPAATGTLRLLEAHIAIGAGDSERAYALLLEDLPDVRTSTQQHDLLAAVMLRTSRYSEAAAVYRALLTVDPRNARWWAGYAVTQDRLEHRTEVISAYRTVQSLAAPGTALAAWAMQRLDRIG